MSDVDGVDADLVLPLVVGAHLEAERHDRALAYGLSDEIAARQGLMDGPMTFEPLVCCDLWYLNDDALRLRPTLTIGRPEINAATAFLASRVPTMMVREDAYRIQLDPEFIERRGCIWGTDAEATAEAVKVFIDRYLAEYLQAVL
ncbi:MAG: hypothetical protein GY715_17370 [Planctomycetes bacterium]|nr:hypothetical protein [Planctomycetota bacterium]